MAVNVILTFDNIGGEYQDTQEFFDLKIPVKKSDTDVTAFLNKKFFPKIFEECIKFNRNHDLKSNMGKGGSLLFSGMLKRLSNN